MFKSTAQRLYKFVGKTRLTDLAPEEQTPVYQFLDAEEKNVSEEALILYSGLYLLLTQDPSFKNAEIRSFIAE